MLRNYASEVNILRKLDHQNCLKVYDCYQDEQFIYVVSEFIKGKNLFDYIQSCPRVPERIIGKTVQQLISAINYCHNIGIMHGDIKPENILISNYKDENSDPIIKLICFKRALKFTPGQLFTDRTRYTVAYRAPEVVSGSYDSKCEVWSLGIILYLMVTRNLPFDGVNEDHVQYRLTHVANRMFLCSDRDYWEKQDEGMVDLLMKMLEWRAEKRITIRACCNHSWFKKLEE